MKGPVTSPAPSRGQEKGRDFGKVPEMINANGEKVSEQDLCGKIKGIGTI